MADGVEHESRLRFAVLGPVRVWRGTKRLEAGSPQQRALLAALLLRGGRTATAGELVDALWGDEPPHAALAALRTYASRLRKALGPDAETLASESGGYAIRPKGEGTLDLDAARAQRYADEAERARLAGDRARARELLDAALRQWDGEPLAGLPGPYCDTQRTRLSEWRLTLLESRLALDLEVGHHAEAVSELTALTAAHPLRERLRELLMLALYRSGRQAEALAVYADTRRLLADELGVDPCASLAELHQRILRADADLDTPAAALDEGAGEPADIRPRQLPATVPDFTGRTAVVGELGRRLASTEGSVMAVSAVAGIGGVGKTTLAVHVAHAACDHFPDGQLYVDLQGAGPSPVEPEAVLGAFLRALGTPDAAIPGGVAERSALYRSTLAGRRILALLDNARDAAQIRPLLPGTEGCAALITSRARMVDLAGAHLVDLDVMCPEEALALFTRIVGQERVDAERAAAMDVVAACGFLPLAIRIAASRLAARRTWTVATLADNLADERRRLDELRAGDLTVKASFELGYRQLEGQQARAFRLLGLADGPDISLPAAAALLGMDGEAADETEDLLEALVDTSLLQSSVPGRYHFHDLVRLYARCCAERYEQPAEREAARSRLLDFYLATAAQVYAIMRPGDPLSAHLDPPHHPGLAFESHEAALDWLFTEARCLLACARAAGRGPTLGRAAGLLMTAKDLAESGADARQYEQVTTDLLTAARAAGDARTEGRLRVNIAHVHLLACRFDKAERDVEAAMAIRLRCRDPMLSAHALNESGMIASGRRQYADAEAYLVRALEAFRSYGNRNGEASALCNLSRVCLGAGRLEEAVDLAERALVIFRDLGGTLRLANGLYVLGVAFMKAGRTEDALRQLSQAVVIFQDSRQRLWAGMTYRRMAEIHLAADRPAQAAGLAEQALAALRGTGSERRRAHTLTVLGRALRRIGHADRARACWQEALTIYERLGAPRASQVRQLIAS